MSESTSATKTSKLEPTSLFLFERLRLFTNYWVLPTLYLLLSLLRFILAYLGDYMNLPVNDLPLTGTLGLFLVYMLVIMRFIISYVRNIFGLNSATPSPISALFTNQEVFKKYQIKVKANLFGKEKRFIVLWIIVSIVFYALTELFISGTFGKPYGTVESPIGLVDYFFAFMVYIFIAFILGGIIWIFIGILRSIRALGYAEGLTIGEYMNTLKPSSADEGRAVGISELGSTTIHSNNSIVN